jgi:hypothetical protein
MLNKLWTIINSFVVTAKVIVVKLLIKIIVYFKTYKNTKVRTPFLSQTNLNITWHDFLFLAFCLKVF